jgi:hypothetical protein
MALADEYASSKDSPTYGIENRVALKAALEAALKPGEPIGYRYKYLNFMGDEVWAFDPPRNGKVLETVPVYTAAPPAKTPPPRLTDDDLMAAHCGGKDMVDGLRAVETAVRKQWAKQFGVNDE